MARTGGIGPGTATQLPGDRGLINTDRRGNVPLDESIGVHVLDDLAQWQGQAGILDHGERSFRLVVLPKVAFATCFYLELCAGDFNAPGHSYVRHGETFAGTFRESRRDLDRCTEPSLSFTTKSATPLRQLPARRQVGVNGY